MRYVLLSRCRSLPICAGRVGDDLDADRLDAATVAAVAVLAAVVVLVAG
jgi:hypothetical protein